MSERAAEWETRREAMRAEKAPTLPVVVRAIETEVRSLLGLAEAVAAGRVPLTDFLGDRRPGEVGRVQVLAALWLNSPSAACLKSVYSDPVG